MTARRKNIPTMPAEMRETIEKDLESCDVGDRGSDPWKTGFFMLAALEYGTDIVVLSKICGIPREFIRPRAKALRENQIWRGRKTYANWADENGGFALILDIMVAEGELAKTWDGATNPDEAKLAITDKGREAIDATEPAKEPEPEPSAP